jgi:hypothetical protein
MKTKALAMPGQQPLHQQRRGVGEKPAQAHEQTGQQRAAHQQGRRAEACHQPRRGQRAIPV